MTNRDKYGKYVKQREREGEKEREREIEREKERVSGVYLLNLHLPYLCSS